jgi:O-methyltransferase involved in polyketide biosynthesis
MEQKKIDLRRLGGTAETLLFPLYFRAVENQRPDPMVRDAKAADLVRELDYDFSKAQRIGFDQVLALMRMREFDGRVRSFLEKHPTGRVVEIGCGLDTRFWRVDNGAGEWYELDLPEVIAVRAQLLPEEPCRRLIGCSALDLHWMDMLPKPQGGAFLFVAEGVFPYFKEPEVKRLLLAVKEHFPGSELVFDALSPFMVWLGNLILTRAKTNARVQWGLRDDRELEAWDSGLHLLRAWYYYDRPEPRLGIYQAMKWVGLFNRAARVLSYGLELNSIS